VLAQAATPLQAAAFMRQETILCISGAQGVQWCSLGEAVLMRVCSYIYSGLVVHLEIIS
jgi:hypothetical protein